jgi:hypothetical protein
MMQAVVCSGANTRLILVKVHIESPSESVLHTQERTMRGCCTTLAQEHSSTHGPQNPFCVLLNSCVTKLCFPRHLHYSNKANLP